MQLSTVSLMWQLWDQKVVLLILHALRHCSLWSWIEFISFILWSFNIVQTWNGIYNAIEYEFRCFQRIKHMEILWKLYGCGWEICYHLWEHVFPFQEGCSVAVCQSCLLNQLCSFRFRGALILKFPACPVWAQCTRSITQLYARWKDADAIKIPQSLSFH